MLQKMSRNMLQNMKRRVPQKIRIRWSLVTPTKDDNVSTVLFQKKKKS